MKIKEKSYWQIVSTIVALIVFLLPTNFFFKFLESESYVNGLMVDYLIPKIYLTDVFLVLLVGVWLTRAWFFKSWSFGTLQKTFKVRQIEKKLKKIETGIWVLALALFFRQFLSEHLVSTLVYSLRFGGLILFLWMLSGRVVKKPTGEKLNKLLIEKAMLAAMLFQSSVAIYQYYLQKTLYGYLLLGEPNLNNFIGISKTSIFGAEKILPYGTTAHPNVLGGFLAVYILYFVQKIKKPVKLSTKIDKAFNLQNAIIVIAFLTLLLTQSASAIATLVFGILLLNHRTIFKRVGFKKVTINLRKVLVVFFISLIATVGVISIMSKNYPENSSLVRRNYLNTASIKMTTQNLVFGVGLNNFTATVEKYSSSREIVRFVQPVHSVFLLFLAETGLVGVILVGQMIFLNKKKIKEPQLVWFLILLPIGLLDHYLLSLNTGLLLTAISLGFFAKNK